MQSVCGGERREEMPQDERGEGCRHCVCHLCVSQNEMRRLNCQGAPGENLQNWKCAGKLVSFDSQLQQCHQAESSSPLLQEKNVTLLLKSNLQSKVQTL